MSSCDCINDGHMEVLHDLDLCLGRLYIRLRDAGSDYAEVQWCVGESGRMYRVLHGMLRTLDAGSLTDGGE
jgi:hypothetical protein